MPPQGPLRGLEPSPTSSPPPPPPPPSASAPVQHNVSVTLASPGGGFTSNGAGPTPGPGGTTIWGDIGGTVDSTDVFDFGDLPELDPIDVPGGEDRLSGCLQASIAVSHDQPGGSGEAWRAERLALAGWPAADVELVTDWTQAFGACSRCPSLHFNTCDCPDLGPFPRVSPRTLATAAAAYRLSPLGRGSAEARRFFAEAWGVLLRNVDAAEWTICAITGNRNAGGCIRRKIRGENRVQVMFAPWLTTIAAGFSTAMVSGTGLGIANVLATVLSLPVAAVLWLVAAVLLGDTLFIGTGRNQRVWNSLLRLWRQGGGAADCARVALAATLFHELVHLCNREIFFGTDWPLTPEIGEDTLGACSLAYRAENLFRWVVQRRTPGLSFPHHRSGAACCYPADFYLCQDRTLDLNVDRRQVNLETGQVEGLRPLGPELNKRACRQALGDDLYELE